MGDSSNQKPEGPCKFSIFLFILVLALVLGGAFVVIPIFTFEQIDTVRNTPVGTDLQFAINQSDKYNALWFKATQSQETGIYIYKKDYVLKPSSRHSFQSLSLEQKLTKGQSAAGMIYYMPRSFLEIEADGDNGTAFSVKLMTPHEYDEFKKKNSVITMATPDSYGGEPFYTNHTYDSNGINYVVVTNTGKEGNVQLSATVQTPMYNLTTNDAVAWCVNESECKFQNLPRNYFALVNVHIQDMSKMNGITIVQMYDDTFRWTFPILVYALLAFVIIMDIIIYCACAAVAKKRSVGGYSQIQDGAINS